MKTRPPELPGYLAAGILAELRQKSPLIHCMTNDVVTEFTANVLLAIGASPAMIVAKQEVAQFMGVADALLINIGTLNDSQTETMLAAVNAANQQNRPWVLDPVAVGGLNYRTGFARQLLALHPTAVRGNASEVIALASDAEGGRGVDSRDDSFSALPAARLLARRYETVVAVTGETDYITDGENTWAVTGGDKMMTRVVGTGCTLSAVVAACLALNGTAMDKVAAACQIMSVAGSQAIVRAKGPGSFGVEFLDALYLMQPEMLSQEVR